MNKQANITLSDYRLLRREKAAVYIGVGLTTFDALVRDGVVPPPRRLKTIRVWDKRDLDNFVDTLPVDEPHIVADTWDD